MGKNQPLASPTMRIVIDVQDGVIQTVVASQPVEYLIYDRDTEGADAEDLAMRPCLRHSGAFVKTFNSASTPAYTTTAPSNGPLTACSRRLNAFC